MEDNEYDTIDKRRNLLLLTTSSSGSFQGNWEGHPCGERVIYIGSITSHCYGNEPALHETEPLRAAGIQPTDIRTL